MEPPSHPSSYRRRKPRRPQPRAGAGKPDVSPLPVAAPGRRRFFPVGIGVVALLGTLALLSGLLDLPVSAQGAGATAVQTPRDLGSIALDILLVLVLTLFNALFSMAETALVSVRRSRVEQLIEEGNRAALAVKRLIENPPRFIATVQVGITVLGFASAAAAATTLAQPLIGPLRRFFPGELAATLAVVVVTVAVAYLSMVLGEIAPKSLAVNAPDVWALRLAPFVNLCATLFAPLTWLVVAGSNLLVRPFGMKAQFEAPAITEEELKQIIEHGEEKGELDAEERVMLHNVFGLGDTQVRSVMTPRMDMTALPLGSNLSAILETILESGHSRIPVYEGTIDNVVGIVHAKDLLPALRSDLSESARQELDLRSVMRAPYFVPETKRVSELLAEFRRSNQQVAIVQDEYAGTEGLVTIEDLLEEIVGDIRDEYDVDEPDVQVISPTESLIDARMTIDDVNDRLGTELPHEDYQTIGGLIFGLLGHEPTPGDHVRWDGLDFLIERLEGRRIRTLRAVKISAPGDAEAIRSGTGE